MLQIPKRALGTVATLGLLLFAACGSSADSPEPDQGDTAKNDPMTKPSGPMAPADDDSAMEATPSSGPGTGNPTGDGIQVSPGLVDPPPNPQGRPEGDGYAQVPCPEPTDPAARVSTPVARLDLLLVVDDGSSMAEEQLAWRDALPHLLDALTAGDQGFGDVHVGVVSSDMGAVGVTGIEGCGGVGADGVLQSTPAPGLAQECPDDYPRYASFEAGDDVDALAHDVGCLSVLGAAGCAVRQPLEAAAKALWPSVDRDPLTGEAMATNRVTFLGDENGFHTFGHGDTDNVGFLRDDQLSVLAVLVISDQDDCSVKSTAFLTEGQDPRELCRANQDWAYAKERYINVLRALRPQREQLVVFGAIGGMPIDDADGAALDFDWSDDAEREAFYTSLLADERMRGESPACSSGRGDAFASRRAIEVAQGFGDQGFVGSICEEDFGPALERFADAVKLAGRRGDSCYGTR